MGLYLFKAKNFLERMATQINRLYLLIQDLLEVSRIQTGKLALNKRYRYYYSRHIIYDSISGLSDNTFYKGA
jgi:signal transduction histidine kinase